MLVMASAYIVQSSVCIVPGLGECRNQTSVYHKLLQFSLDAVCFRCSAVQICVTIIGKPHLQSGLAAHIVKYSVQYSPVHRSAV